MEYKRKQGLWLALMNTGVAGILTIFAFAQSQTVWKFDVAIIGAFLSGRVSPQVGTWTSQERNVQGCQSDPLECKVRFMGATWLSSVWFLLVVLLVGEFSWLAAKITGVLYAGPLPWYSVGEISLMLCLLLAYDFLAHYGEQVKDDFWEDIPA